MCQNSGNILLPTCLPTFHQANSEFPHAFCFYLPKNRRKKQWVVAPRALFISIACTTPPWKLLLGEPTCKVVHEIWRLCPNLFGNLRLLYHRQRGELVDKFTVDHRPGRIHQLLPTLPDGPVALGVQTCKGIELYLCQAYLKATFLEPNDPRLCFTN